MRDATVRMGRRHDTVRRGKKGKITIMPATGEVGFSPRTSTRSGVLAWLNSRTASRFGGCVEWLGVGSWLALRPTGVALRLVLGGNCESAMSAMSAKYFWPTREVRLESAMSATTIWQTWDIWPAGLRSARSGGLNRPTPMWLVDWSLVAISKSDRAAGTRSTPTESTHPYTIRFGGQFL